MIILFYSYYIILIIIIVYQYSSLYSIFIDRYNKFIRCQYVYVWYVMMNVSICM